MLTGPALTFVPPSIECIAHFIKHLKDSAPGPDGIPYSCYKALLDVSAMLFFWANLILLAGGTLGINFNIQRACFIPKNRANDGVAPRADELRSLGLKNTDSKAIVGATVRQVRHVVSSNAVSIKRGLYPSQAGHS